MNDGVWTLTETGLDALVREYINKSNRLQKRLDHIARIIDTVDARCLAYNRSGQLQNTLYEMTDSEMLEIYSLAVGKKKPARKKKSSRK